MAEITAAMVKDLRERTQLPMMDCKKALQEAGGDMEKAEDALRKAGAVAAAKKAGRETAEGRVATFVSADGSKAGLVEIRCETAPVANTDGFMALCNAVAKQVATSATLASSVEELMAQKTESGETVQDLFNALINQIRENMLVKRFARIDGATIATYEHHNGRVAVALQMAGPVNDAKMIEFGRDVCMHITAIGPMALNRDEIAADVVAKEKEIIEAQVGEPAGGKPKEIIDKMVVGKLNKWYNERVLLEQPFVKDDKKSVQQAVEGFAKELGKPVSLTKYVRYEVGGLD